jgi:hypothetical protein
MLCSDLAYSNDVISVSKIGLVGKNGLIVALALEGTPGFMAGRVLPTAPSRAPAAQA